MMTTNEQTNRERSTTNLQELLGRDHERLERLFVDLVAAFEADARDDAGRLWNEFDAGLRRHFHLEETRILPELAKAYPTEAAELLSEHAVIRAKLLELGIGVDLHFTRADAVKEFVRALEDHANREDALMYRWAESNLPEDVKTTLREQLLTRLRRAVGAA